ncbi:carbohydrate ABC transporter permease [Thalassovita taeanensis]|uniref:Carbohydrate ABC transporter membrane protein 2, CUT1 family n=1 Tax=Thalassovita taeanensis TaxID=657014 RepID=A0A1H9HDY7_9RHOB|nr:carbohydrate ABC transporter permease [Thalassovita taeanensis]SEQ60507.1 carbohydrate ABC transporter membrane protein 2, CUT1 family [Thalassovita taeanensis]
MTDTPVTLPTSTFQFSATEAAKHVVLILGALIVLLPFYVMVSYTLKTPVEIMSGSGGLFGTQTPFTDAFCLKAGGTDVECTKSALAYNFGSAFKKAPLLRYLLNGVAVTAAIFLIQVVVALPCAYALAKLRFWGRDAVFSLVLFCLLIPVHAIALPLFIMLAKLGLTNSYAALIVPWTISVFGIFLMRQFFMTVPDDLIDAARMDGMSEFSIIWQVMLPTAIPALMAFAIFSVVAHWNDYFWPRIVITGDKSLFTPPLGLREFRAGLDGNDFGPMMATACVIVTPLIICFLLAQRRFIEGITLTGMK